MLIRVGINGFGRIGRAVFRAGVNNPKIEFVAINDITTPQTLAHLLKYDSVHGRLGGEIISAEGRLIVNGKDIRITAIKDPSQLPWQEMDVEIVIEATGKFRDRKETEKHLSAGAKRVIISAPAKGEDITTIVMGINEDKYDAQTDKIISMASCTTNCLAIIAKILLDRFGIKRGLMTTIHAYTNDQQILDLAHSDLRRARAAGLSIIPTTTGAAKAIGLVLPQLKGQLDGLSIRVPTPNVSIVDLVAELEQQTTTIELNSVLKDAAEGAFSRYLEYCEEPLVSCDFNGNPKSAIVDATNTFVINGNLVKVLSWYDNEWGYSCRIIDLIEYIAGG